MLDKDDLSGLAAAVKTLRDAADQLIEEFPKVLAKRDAATTEEQFAKLNEIVDWLDNQISLYTDALRSREAQLGRAQWTSPTSDDHSGLLLDFPHF